jgi:hypothetical protein
VQWAAVRICFLETRVPPQNQVELKDNPTIHGNSRGWVLFPPTIRVDSVVPHPSNNISMKWGSFYGMYGRIKFIEFHFMIS